MYHFQDGSVKNALSGVVEHDIRREVQLNAKRSENVSIRHVVEGKVVVSDVKALVLVTYVQNVNTWH